VIALRAGIFQLRYLDRVPAHAVVNDSVEFVKSRLRKAAPFVNAVLRKVNREPVRWPDEATELSCPAWLLARWKAHFGAEPARQIARAALIEPNSYIRVALGEECPEDAQPTDVAGCYQVSHARGRRLQDIGSQSIVPLLELQPGETFLDLCAAPGNKTLQALEAQPRFAIACDVSERRLRTIPRACPLVGADGINPLPVAGTFDRVFVDAPCSGTGTLARNPEIKWRVQAEDFRRSGEKAKRLAENALKVMGRRLVFATCSLEEEENEQVVRYLLERGLGLHLKREQWRLPGRDEGDGFYAAAFER
jgi:16S rRNA (cytosine967-C5)-methyltransferase